MYLFAQVDLIPKLPANNYSTLKHIDMFLLVIIFCQVTTSSTKVINHQRDVDFGTDNGILAPEEHQTGEVHFETWDDTLWVLKLNERELNFTYLRSATESEEEYFDEEMGPLLHSHPIAYIKYKQRQQANRVKKDDPMKSYPLKQFLKNVKPREEKEIHNNYNNDAKQELIQIINKFILSFQKEPATNLPEEMEAYEIPTLTLYFKGPFTVLLVNYERLVWQFFIKPPSTLPEWLYNEHSNISIDEKGMYAAIPDAVTEELIEKLLHLLKKLFSYPL